MVKENTYVSIQAFMINELHLKGNELIIYAVIYGYTQDEQHWFYGTRSHLAEWCGASKGTVSNCLKSLQDKGYIRRREIERHGYTEIQYQAVSFFDTPYQKLEGGGVKNCETPLSKIDSNNKIEDNSNNDNNKKERETFDSIIDSFTDHEELRSALREFLKYRKASKNKNPFTNHALKLNLAKLRSLTDDDAVMVDIINQTIMKGWAGFYPLKDSKPKQESGVKWDAELEELAAGFDF